MNIMQRIQQHEENREKLERENKAITEEIDQRVIEWFRMLKGDPAVLNIDVIRLIDHLDDEEHRKPCVTEWHLRHRRIITHTEPYIKVVIDDSVLLELEPWVLIGDEAVFTAKRAESDQRKAAEVIRKAEAKKQHDIELNATRLRLVTEAAEKLGYKLVPA